MRRSGVRIPLAPPQADIRSGCRFFVCLAWCCGACCCGALSPLVFRAPDRLPVGLAAVCAGGRRPAREIATREPDGSEWSISRPALALPPPTSTAARPSGPSGALHTGGACSVCRLNVWPGPATAHGRRRLALRLLRHPSHLWAGALACAWRVDSLSGRTAVAGVDSRETVNTFAGVCSVFGETDDTIASQIHPFLVLFYRAKASWVSYRRPEVPALVLTVTCCGAVSSMGATKFARRGLLVTIARKYAPSAGRMAQNERFIAGWASVFASVGGWGVYWAIFIVLRHLHQVTKPSTGTEVEPFHACLPSRPTKPAA